MYLIVPFKIAVKSTYTIVPSIHVAIKSQCFFGDNGNDKSTTAIMQTTYARN